MGICSMVWTFYGLDNCFSAQIDTVNSTCKQMKKKRQTKTKLKFILFVNCAEHSCDFVCLSDDIIGLSYLISYLVYEITFEFLMKLFSFSELRSDWENLSYIILYHF